METTTRPHTTDPAVTTVTPADHTAVAGALASAFHDDPVFTWIYPDPERRRALLPDGFRIFTEAIARHGVSHVAGDGGAAALWVPPGEEVTDDEEAFGEALVTLSGDDAERLLTVMEVLGESHPHEPSWYLNLVGVSAARQGHGIGSALLRAGIARAEATGVPCYLEATSHANRRLYERHGFVVADDLVVPGGPTLWAMWRR